MYSLDVYVFTRRILGCFYYLLLVFSLNTYSRFNTLPSFYECLSLRNFAWIMGKYSSNVGAKI